MESASNSPKVSIGRREAGSATSGRMVLCVVFLVSALLATACARTKIVSETIYKDDRISIRLVERLDKDKNPVPQGNDQPWEVDAETLEALLNSIRFRSVVVFFKGKPQPAFPNPQRLRMLKPLQEAFAKAGPNQWVDFSFQHRWNWLFVTRQLFTDGVLFRKNGKLNCAFRNLAFESIDDPEGTSTPFRGNPTKEPIRNDWVLVLQPGQNLKRIEKPGFLGPKNFPNWIQVDLARKYEPPEEEEKKLKEEKAKLEEEKDALEGVESGVEGAPTREEINKQMEWLEELHQEGAISDNAYKQKKNELEKMLKMVSPPPKK